MFSEFFLPLILACYLPVLAKNGFGSMADSKFESGAPVWVNLPGDQNKYCFTPRGDRPSNEYLKYKNTFGVVT